MKLLAFSSFLALASASPTQEHKLQSRVFHAASSSGTSAPFNQAIRQLRGGAAKTRALQGHCDLTVSTTCSTTNPTYKPTSYIGHGIVASPTASLFSEHWDTSCGGIPMHEAGGTLESADKERASSLFVDWDCQTGVMCVLVKLEDDKVDAGYFFVEDDAMWVKDYAGGSDTLEKKDKIIHKTFSAEDSLIAWQACFDMSSSCRSSIEIHSNYAQGPNDPQLSAGGRTTSTGKGTKLGSKIGLDLDCSCAIDEECKIDDCYTGYTCTSVGSADGSLKCDYGFAEKQCCVSGEVCGDGLDCSIDASSTTGKCTSKEDAPGGSESTCTPEACFAVHTDTTHSNECADVECSDNQCLFSEKTEPEPTSCTNSDITTFEHEQKNDCYIDNVCAGFGCVARYHPAGDKCPNDVSLSACAMKVCRDDPSDSGRTVCVEEARPDTHECRSSVGDCDKAETCNGESYDCPADVKHGVELTCRLAAGDCDKAETCDGKSNDCPDDVKYGPEYTCRDSCDDCLGDPAEVCPGGDLDECPANIIMNQDIEIMAAQSNNAGTVSVVATPIDDDETKVCIIIKPLVDGWALREGAEAIKIYLAKDYAPTSSAGQYGFKFPDTAYNDVGGFELCRNFPTGSNMYLAIHLDVTKDGSQDTAWAKMRGCENEEIALLDGGSALTPSQFMTKGGTNKRITRQKEQTSSGSGTTTGWGCYYFFSLCDTEMCKEVDGDAEGGTPSTVTPSTDTPSTDTPSTGSGDVTWTCQNNEAPAQQLTCSTGFEPNSCGTSS